MTDASAIAEKYTRLPEGRVCSIIDQLIYDHPDTSASELPDDIAAKIKELVAARHRKIERPMIYIRCSDCGALIAAHLKHEHRCAQKSKPKRKPTTKPVAKTAASSKNSPSSRRIEPPIDLPALPKRL